MSQDQPLSGKRELTAGDVVDASVPVDLAVSPDGRWVAYQVSRVGKRAGAPLTSLWLAPANGGSPARMLADDTGWNAMPRWAPDSSSLYVVSDRKERGVPRLYRMRPDDGGLTELPAPWGAMSGYLPLTDGRTLAVLAGDEPTGDDERRLAEGDGDTGACVGAFAMGWTNTEVAVHSISPSLDVSRPVPCTTP